MGQSIYDKTAKFSESESNVVYKLEWRRKIGEIVAAFT